MSYNGSWFNGSRYNRSWYFVGPDLVLEAELAAEEERAAAGRHRNAVRAERARVSAAMPALASEEMRPPPAPAPIAPDPELVGRLTRQFTDVRARQGNSGAGYFVGGIMLPPV